MRITAFVAAVMIGAATLAAQSPEIRPTWKNLETWTRPAPPADETEIGLGLHFGSTSMAFKARFAGKATTPPAKEITIVVAMGPNFVANVVQSSTLLFFLDEGQPKWGAIDFSSRFIGNQLAPTMDLRSGVATISADELRRLTRARALKTKVLGVEGTFSRAQLDALRAYARRVAPEPRK
jgi:hypothetical protein